MNLELAGRAALITGGNRGIGLAIARGLAAEGVHVALLARDQGELNKASAQLRSTYPAVRVTTERLDLTDADTIAPAVVKAATALGAVDILVNCAGAAFRGRFEEVPEDRWERDFKIKPIGMMRVTLAALPFLKRSTQGRIINIAGSHGREPSRFSVLAGPTNLAALSATKALASELGPLGITVNAINPGSTNSARWDELVRITSRDMGVSAEKAVEHLVREVPLGRVVKMEEVADLAVFLASARAAMISGCAINVDGGRSRSV